jgi:hypothetical protein
MFSGMDSSSLQASFRWVRVDSDGFINNVDLNDKKIVSISDYCRYKQGWGAVRWLTKTTWMKLEALVLA